MHKSSDVWLGVVLVFVHYRSDLGVMMPDIEVHISALIQKYVSIKILTAA